MRRLNLDQYGAPSDVARYPPTGDSDGYVRRMAEGSEDHSNTDDRLAYGTPARGRPRYPSEVSFDVMADTRLVQWLDGWVNTDSPQISSIGDGTK